jgi:diguanylate cyclase (GGDEF)-like protein
MKLLLVEDNPGDADFLAACLRRQRASDIETVKATSLKQALEKLGSDSFDIVLLDLQLPDARGLEAVTAIQSADDTVPIVVLSGQDDEDLAISILNKGVQDYLVKWEGQGRTMLRSIRYAIERKRSETRLNYLAQFDPLTGVPNRQHFSEQLTRATARARRDGRQCTLLFLDLDDFKDVNDTLGHDAGDHLLKELATRLRGAIRTGDTVARLGGDEFAVLLEGISNPVDVESLAKGLLDVVAQPFNIAGRQLKTTASIGITMYPTDNADTMMMLKNADIAMYEAKEQGGNTFRFFTEGMHEALMAYHELEHDIRAALANEQFSLVFQPKVDLRNRRLQGLEALLRWDHPVRGKVSPAEFIPVAEESGHIVPIGYWVLEEVCRTLKGWEKAGLPVIPVSVNVSARQFQQADFHKRVAEILHRHGVNPGMVEIELTERLVMQNTEASQAELARLKEIGLRISIDDFGTGYSCLSYLHRFPIDVLKIDRSFVCEVGVSAESEVIIEAIISLARSLKLDTVAEGVETPAQLDFLLERGCHVAQGFLLGMPLQREQVAPLLEEYRREAPADADAARPVAPAVAGTSA